MNNILAKYNLYQFNYPRHRPLTRRLKSIDFRKVYLAHFLGPSVSDHILFMTTGTVGVDT